MKQVGLSTGHFRKGWYVGKIANIYISIFVRPIWHLYTAAVEKLRNI